MNITAVSYMGKVDVGFIVDPELVENAWGLTDATEAALAELVEAVDKETAMQSTA